jgi:alpha-amylase
LNRQGWARFSGRHPVFAFLVRSLLGLCFVCAIAFLLPASCSTAPAVSSDANSAAIVYQAFDLPFQTVRAKLPELKQAGYTYIQVSPPQKSNPAKNWWARYQPIDHTILDSPLGTEQDLRQLIRTAHRQNLKIIVDVVLNHMANYGDFARTLQYPHFSPQDFHPQSCINYGDRTSVIMGWINCDLPDLKTSSPHVRQQAKTYLQKLISLGADGFRFDAAKHIEPDFFQKVLSGVTPDKLVYGEVIGQTLAESNEYTPVFRVTDFQLLSTMISAFSYGGDFRSLINPATNQKALADDRAITFANNHDIENGQIGYKFSDHQDTILATGFILARQAGVPTIYRDDANNPITKAGIQFHQRMNGQQQRFLNSEEIVNGMNNPNLLLIQRGDQGLAIINKAGEELNIPSAKMPGLAIGCYQELHYNFPVTVGKGSDGQKYVTRWGTTNRAGIQMDARDALFLVKAGDRVCKR